MNKRYTAKPMVMAASALVTTKNGRVKLATNRDEAGRVSQKMVALARRKADDIVEGDEKKEWEGEGKNRAQPTNLYQKELVPKYQPLSNRAYACDPLRIDRRAVWGVIPPSFVAPQSDGFWRTLSQIRGGARRWGEVQGYTKERLVLDRNGSAIPIETDFSLPSAFPADLPMRCPEQLKERSRVSTKNAVGSSGSTHPDVSIPPVNQWVSLPNKRVAL